MSPMVAGGGCVCVRGALGWKLQGKARGPGLTSWVGKDAGLEDGSRRHDFVYLVWGHLCLSQPGVQSDVLGCSRRGLCPVLSLEPCPGVHFKPERMFMSTFPVSPSVLHSYL